MAVRRMYVCRDCTERVTPGSFRATCPQCGGPLRTDPAAGPTPQPRAE